MKKISVFLVFSALYISGSAQFIYKIKADSVLITNDSCNAELNLENSTRAILGFLFNKGNGRTEFKKGLYKLNDSTFIIGADTLHLAGLGNYIKNQTAQQASSNFNISGNGTIGNNFVVSGNTGLGTSSPQARLDVHGQIWATSASDTSALYVGRISTGRKVFEVRANYNATENGTSIYIGDSSGASVTAINPYDGAQNTALGGKAMKLLTTGLHNTAFGGSTLENCTSCNFNDAIGQFSLNGLVTGDDNTSVGQAAMIYKTSGNYNVAIGSNALEDNITGSTNTAIGKSAGLTNSGSGNVLIGFQAGRNSGAVSNKLYITNTSTSSPLIYGEFDNSYAKINGKLQTTDTLTATTMGTADSSDRVATTKWVKQSYLAASSGAEGTVIGRTSSGSGSLELVSVPVVIAKGTVSSASNLSIDLSNYYNVYDIIEIYFYSIQPSTNGAALYMRYSPDGTNYDASSSNYLWNFNFVIGSSEGGNDETTDGLSTAIKMTGACGNSSGRSTNVFVRLYNPGSSSFQPMCDFSTHRLDDTGTAGNITGTGVRRASQLTKGVRFLFSSGNISTGVYKVIGIKN
jgi:hypothetical protein